MIEGQEGLTWARWRRIAEAVDTLGFESLWRSDHLFSLFDVPDRPGLDTWASLAVLAMMTRRIRFGPLVCPITFHHPSLLARQAAAGPRPMSARRRRSWWRHAERSAATRRPSAGRGWARS